MNCLYYPEIEKEINNLFEAIVRSRSSTHIRLPRWTGVGLIQAIRRPLDWLVSSWLRIVGVKILADQVLHV